MDNLRQKLIEEYTQLDEMAQKLNAFINSVKYYQLDKHNRALLSIQFSAMQTYLTCLDERIKLTEG